MGKILKVLLIIAIAIGIGVFISMAMEMKERFFAMSEEEQRSFIAEKLGDKVPEDKLTEIQDAVVTAVADKKGEAATPAAG
jgi:hypothetical protein